MQFNTLFNTFLPKNLFDCVDTNLDLLDLSQFLGYIFITITKQTNPFSLNFNNIFSASEIETCMDETFQFSYLYILRFLEDIRYISMRLPDSFMEMSLIWIDTNNTYSVEHLPIICLTNLGRIYLLENFQNSPKKLIQMLQSNKTDEDCYFIKTGFELTQSKLFLKNS
jgi:hypothetical protein